MLCRFREEGATDGGGCKVAPIDRPHGRSNVVLGGGGNRAPNVVLLGEKRRWRGRGS